MEEEKIYEPWVVGLGRVVLHLGCYQTLEKAQEILGRCICENFTASTLCNSGINVKILYKDHV